LEVLILCEGKNDVNFIKGLIEGSCENVKFLECPDDLDRLMRGGFFRKIVCGIGGKDQLPKRAKRMISTFRSTKGSIEIVYVKDMVTGNRIMENLNHDIEEFIGSPGKFPQDKPKVDIEVGQISVSFRNLKLNYHIVGVERSLELNVWEKVRDGSREITVIEERYDDVHERIKSYCESNDESVEEFFERSVDLFGEEEWFVRLRDKVNL
jgi:hypothetical protein